MTRYKKGFDFNIVNIENLPIFYQCFVILDMHLRQFIQSPIHFATNSAFLVPGHTWGHLVYLIDDAYLFTGDTIWFGADGGYAFLNTLAEDGKLQCTSLKKLEEKLRKRNQTMKIITGHTGWTDDFEFAFRHVDEICNALRRKPKVQDPKAPYDGFDESGDTEDKARTVILEKC